MNRMDSIMKTLVGIIIVFVAVWCSGMPSINTFSAVTNDWYNANFTNVYELAQHRMANNSNDVVAAYLMLEWNMSFASVTEVSNSVTRVIQLSDTVTNAAFVATYSKIRQACLAYRDEYLSTVSAAEVEAERHKAYTPHTSMVNSELLKLLDIAGLW